MKKIISLFQRNYDTDGLVCDEIVRGAEWVVAGEGVPTQKHDGTACFVRNGKLYKRYVYKKGRVPPTDFEPAGESDPVTGHWPGWIPVGQGPQDKWHREAWEANEIVPFLNGTYELCGEKIRGNPEGLRGHCLIPHGFIVLPDHTPRTFNELYEWLKDRNIEGIVWHHQDGRMVKIKKRDFGLKRNR